MNFLPMKTVYECRGKCSTSYVDILPRHLTIDRPFCKERFQSSNRTPFKEVKVAPFKSATSLAFRNLSKVHHGRVSEIHTGLLARIKATLKDTIAEHWTPGGYHAVLHSSGYDSRCISWLIRELYHERGVDWLGTVVFCCSKWEGSSFKKIMRYEGWDCSQYLVVNESSRDRDYYAPSLTNFRDAWEWSDGASPIPVNLFWYPVVAAIKEGLLPDDHPIQTWTGHNGNVILDARGPRQIRALMCESYKSIFGERPMYGTEVILPYSTIELATVICESSVLLGSRLRPLLLKRLDKKLASFKNIHADGDRHRRIADRILTQMVRAYRNSWYGRTIKPNARLKHRTTEFQPFWYHWTLASLCAHLRREGYRIQ